jgi:RNA polymerase sigma-70 factor (ECF subfamily)
VSPGSKAGPALEELCSAYWYPVYAFIRRQGRAASDAEDLTQAFFAFLLEKQVLARADRERGRFRSYLLTVLRHFLSNERERNLAAKRGGGAIAVALDSDVAERLYIAEGASVENPEESFARSWAVALLDGALLQLKSELAAAGRLDDYERYRGFLAGDADYRDLARETGIREGTLRVSVHRLRARFRELLRRQVADATGSETVDREIRYLIEAVTR